MTLYRKLDKKLGGHSFMSGCSFGNTVVVSTVDWKISTLKITRVKKIVLINFHGSFDPRNFVKGGRLHKNECLERF